MSFIHRENLQGFQGRAQKPCNSRSHFHFLLYFVELQISLLDILYVCLRREICSSPRLKAFSKLTSVKRHLKKDFFRCYYLVLIEFNLSCSSSHQSKHLLERVILIPYYNSLQLQHTHRLGRILIVDTILEIFDLIILVSLEELQGFVWKQKALLRNLVSLGICLLYTSPSPRD